MKTLILTAKKKAIIMSVVCLNINEKSFMADNSLYKNIPLINGSNIAKFIQSNNNKPSTPFNVFDCSNPSFLNRFIVPPLRYFRTVHIRRQAVFRVLITKKLFPQWFTIENYSIFTALSIRTLFYYIEILKCFSKIFRTIILISPTTNNIDVFTITTRSNRTRGLIPALQIFCSYQQNKRQAYKNPQ